MFCGEVINLINLNPNRCFLLSQLLPEAISLDGSRPSTDQEFRYLSLKEYSFILFHHIFWKRTPFPVWVAWVSWVPKVYLGVKTLCKKYQEVPMIALCCYPNVKVEIRDSSQICTTAPIFSKSNYFRQKYLEIPSCAVSLFIYIWVWVEQSQLQLQNLQRNQLL